MGKTTEEDSLFANITMKYYNHPQGDSALEQDQPLLDILSDSVFISPDQKTVQMMSNTPNMFSTITSLNKQTSPLLDQSFNLVQSIHPCMGMISYLFWKITDKS